MKTAKLATRIWLAITSLALFAASWVALAHSPKPVQAASNDLAPMPALPPVPSIEQLANQRELNQGPIIMQRQTARLRTRGS
jgi:hypothetical protein